jgi:hypothetical protein
MSRRLHWTLTLLGGVLIPGAGPWLGDRHATKYPRRQDALGCHGTDAETALLILRAMRTPEQRSSGGESD